MERLTRIFVCLAWEIAAISMPHSTYAWSMPSISLSCITESLREAGYSCASRFKMPFSMDVAQVAENVQQAPEIINAAPPVIEAAAQNGPQAVALGIQSLPNISPEELEKILKLSQRTGTPVNFVVHNVYNITNNNVARGIPIYMKATGCLFGAGIIGYCGWKIYTMFSQHAWNAITHKQMYELLQQKFDALSNNLKDIKSRVKNINRHNEEQRNNLNQAHENMQDMDNNVLRAANIIHENGQNAAENNEISKQLEQNEKLMHENIQRLHALQQQQREQIGLAIALTLKNKNEVAHEPHNLPAEIDIKKLSGSRGFTAALHAVQEFNKDIDKYADESAELFNNLLNKPRKIPQILCRHDVKRQDTSRKVYTYIQAQ